MDPKGQTQQEFPVRFSIRSKSTSAVVHHFPRFRGGAFALSTLLRLMPLDSTATMEVGGKCFGLDLRYRSQLAVFLGSPEVMESTVLFQCLRPGDIFFDVGSNWGYYTFLAAARVGEGGLVVSVEVNSAPFTHLVRIAHRAAVTNLLPLNVAVSSMDGDRVAVHRPWYRADTGGFIELPRAPSSGDVVATRTLDRIWIQLGRPSVRGVKIDVEGFEPLVVRGGQEFLASAVSDFVLVEVSKWSEARCGVPCHKIYEMLNELGFKYAYAFEGGMKVRQLQVQTRSSLSVDRNVVFFKQDVDFTELHKKTSSPCAFGDDGSSEGMLA